MGKTLSRREREKKKEINLNIPLFVQEVENPQLQFLLSLEIFPKSLDGWGVKCARSKVPKEKLCIILNYTKSKFKLLLY